MRSLEFIGGRPALAGQICEGFICEGYEFGGEVVETANVTYLKFDGIWHRLCFDPGTVHWRVWPIQPAPLAFDEEGLKYPHIDVGAAAGLIDVRLRSYSISPTENGAAVVFEFENGRKVLIEDVDDQANYQVI